LGVGNKGISRKGKTGEKRRLCRYTKEEKRKRGMGDPPVLVQKNG